MFDTMDMSAEIVTCSENFNKNKHAKLIDGISQINKIQRIKKSTRNEPYSIASEFHLSKTGPLNVSSQYKKKANVTNVFKVLGNKKKLNKIDKELNKLKNKSTLIKPLEKPKTEKIQRQFAYKKIKEDLGKWDAVVSKNAVADQLVFPLNTEEITVVQEQACAAFNYRIKSNLMKTLEELTPHENKNDNKLMKNSFFKVTLDELKHKRKELARIKLKQSYEIQKRKRMNKIKSKKFHKMKKRDKIRAQMKDFDLLQKNNPEEALKQLELIEKTRIEERANLRHKNTGTWAKNLQIRAKYDKEVRKELAQQLAISREISQKKEIEVSSDEEILSDQNFSKDPSNSWITGKNEIENLMIGYKKYWNERNENTKNFENLADEDHNTTENEAQRNKIINKASNEGDLNTENEHVINNSGTWDIDESNLELDYSSDEETNFADLKIPKNFSNKKNISTVSNENFINKKICKSKTIDKIFDLAEDKIETFTNNKLNNIRNYLKNSDNIKTVKKMKPVFKTVSQAAMGLEFKSQPKKAELDIELGDDKTDEEACIQKLRSVIVTEKQLQPEYIDPNNFINIKPKFIKSSISGYHEMNDMEYDENLGDSSKLTLAVAFEDDDIVAGFMKEKEEEKKLSENVNQSMSGWGSWAGQGVKKNASSGRFITKFPETITRSRIKNDVILTENSNSKLKTHLVSQLPFPFRSVKEYEASIRAPITSTFVPETANKVLTLPEVKTYLGTIIHPMDESNLVKPIH